MKQAQNATRERLALVLFSLATGSVLLAGACTFMLDTSTTQCHSDEECQRFVGTICNVSQRVCVASPDASVAVAGADTGTTPDATASCTDPSGCFACTPSNESEMISHCTDSTCVPFDNSRLTLMGGDGGLRPLPQ